jgi:hypothetical protein
VASFPSAETRRELGPLCRRAADDDAASQHYSWMRDRLLRLFELSREINAYLLL